MRMDLTLLRNKFRGTMQGVLVGDCLGAPYEGTTLSDRKKIYLHKWFNRLEDPNFRAPVMEYTDDSTMTRAVAESLIKKQDLDIVDVAKQLAKNYYEKPERGYGTGAISVLEKLHVAETDVKSPAKELFDGLGSYGNGGAMRVAPVSLFLYNNYDKLIHYVKEVTQITHTHKLGINGAILQAIAIQQSLWLDPNEELNVFNFIDELINKMDIIEDDESKPYKERLSIAKSLVSEDSDDPCYEKVVQELGVNINALESVPTAIYCFLRAQSPIKGIGTFNRLRRAIQYAITLGGDTDTIASMTGAIAGAFYGVDKLNRSLLTHCEGDIEFRDLADKLLDLAISNDLNK